MGRGRVGGKPWRHLMTPMFCGEGAVEVNLSVLTGARCEFVMVCWISECKVRSKVVFFNCLILSRPFSTVLCRDALVTNVSHWQNCSVIPCRWYCAVCRLGVGGCGCEEGNSASRLAYLGICRITSISYLFQGSVWTILYTIILTWAILYYLNYIIYCTILLTYTILPYLKSTETSFSL